MVRDEDGGIIVEAPMPCDFAWMEEKYKKYFLRDEFGLYTNKQYKMPDEFIQKANRYKKHRTYMILRNLYRKRYNLLLFFKSIKLIKYEEDNILGNCNEKTSFDDIMKLRKLLKTFKEDYNEV